MTYSYNRLWKLLIDRGLTKTELKDQAHMSTNIIAKMGNGEPVSMDSLAKICIALNDILEINSDAEKGGD